MICVLSVALAIVFAVLRFHSRRGKWAIGVAVSASLYCIAGAVLCFIAVQDARAVLAAAKAREEEMNQIIALAEQYGAPMYSTSPLRYATELSGLAPKHLSVFCGGAEFPGYVVHLLEMIIKVMGTGATVTATSHTEAACRAELAFSYRQ